MSRGDIERDQDGGAYSSANVPRHRPAAGASSFISLRSTPHRPDQAPPWRAVCGPRSCWPRASGDRRSEI